MKPVEILDSTLRDGAQGENISFTTRDKIEIIKKLDRLGVAFIEAGNPASNPKDMEVFKEAAMLNLKHSRLVAFGATRRCCETACESKSLNALLQAGTDVVSIVGKSSQKQVLTILKTSEQENLSMIYDTISWLKEHGKQVIFDAEHFFDGYQGNPEYALETILTAQKAGAEIIVLCDTNGSTLYEDIARITAIAKNALDIPVGIHCHNDIGFAVANSVAAVLSGATHVQGTYIGFGERCGNANLSSVIPTLQLKLQFSCIPQDCMARLTKTARYVAELANLSLDNSMPYVGKSAFAHKGGMHVDGIGKRSSSFEHIEPEAVGNQRNVLISEMAGRSAMLNVIHEIDDTITKDSKEAAAIVDLLKDMEYKGYLFESAAASLELLITKKLGRFKPFFELVQFKVIGEQTDGIEGQLSSAMIKIRVGNETEITAAEGEGPVHALDLALKKAVMRFYKEAKELRLTDYKVRVMEPSDATAALVRVMIVSTDGSDIWTTVGVSRDIIEASLQALMDSIEYKLMKSVK